MKVFYAAYKIKLYVDWIYKLYRDIRKHKQCKKKLLHVVY